MSRTEREAGSFRDPASFVFYHEGAVYRAVDRETWLCLDQACQSGLLRRLVDKQYLVQTDVVPVESALFKTFQEQYPACECFLKHRKIEAISYPYEWSFSMLADAALLHLDIQQELIAKNCSLKDATAFNVQFEGTRPVFIDVGSIEKPPRADIWYAYGQFCRMFLYPLLLKRRCGLDFKQVFLGSLDGIEVDQAFRMMGFRGSFCSAFLDVFLQRMASGKRVGEAGKVGEKVKQQSGGDPAVQLMNLGRLRRKIEKLKKTYRVGGVWSEYGAIRNYSDEGLKEKQRIVNAALADCSPKTVLDVGCNTGEFSAMASAAGARVTALDADHDSVEMLYRAAKEKKLDILPLVANLANPSPGAGLFCEERKPLLGRVKGEMVFGLALIHHLMVTANMPLPAIARLFAELTEKWLIVEYIDPKDTMFQELLAVRRNYFEDFTRDAFMESLLPHFELMSCNPLPGGLRSVLVMRKKG